MDITSLSYRTDLFFHAFDGVVADRGEYLVITTPSNPTYWWGNFILFAGPPGEGDLARWKAIFSKEIRPPEQLGHMAFGIDGQGGDAGTLEPFLQDGFVLEESVVLSAQQVQPPPKYNHEVSVRPLRTAEEWAQATETQVLCRPPELKEAEYRIFNARKMQGYQNMTEAGKGDWFGAFLGDTLVADLGIFFEGQLARFQSVGTHPDYRRQGICGTLVYQTARYALEHYGVRTLVMVADEHYHAARIYESVGFKPVEKSLGLAWWDRRRH